MDEKLRLKPACDFAADSGLGLALDYLTLRNPSLGRKLGAVGLGVGIMAASSKANDTVHYYELNPAVTDFANKYFFYLKDSAAKIDVVHGDGRLSLERELTTGSQQYDLLHVDAFRGNAPPVHLMTKEAFEIYLRHLKNDGFLIVTSHPGYLNASSLFRGLAKELGLTVKWFSSPVDCESDVGFAVFTRDEKFLLQENVKKRISQWPDNDSRTVLWTDQSSSLMSLMVWR
jgi:spermidine synthase